MKHRMERKLFQQVMTIALRFGMVLVNVKLGFMMMVKNVNNVIILVLHAARNYDISI